MMPEMIEVVDGLLASEDNVIMKARDPGLFPDGVRVYFEDKTKIKYTGIERTTIRKIRDIITIAVMDVPQGEIIKGVTTVTVRDYSRRAVFDADLFNYADKLGIVDCYLSNIPLTGEESAYYPIFIKYRHGWLCIAPMGDD